MGVRSSESVCRAVNQANGCLPEIRPDIFMKQFPSLPVCFIYDKEVSKAMEDTDILTEVAPRFGHHTPLVVMSSSRASFPFESPPLVTLERHVSHTDTRLPLPLV